MMAMLFRTSAGLNSFFFPALFFFAVFFLIALLFAFFLIMAPNSASFRICLLPKTQRAHPKGAPSARVFLFLTLYIQNSKLLRVKWTFSELYISYLPNHLRRWRHFYPLDKVFLDQANVEKR